MGEARRLLFALLVFGPFVLNFLVASDSVRVASINVQNYLLMDRWIDGRWKRDYPKPEKEKRALRSMINQVDPDVLLIQEMGDLPFLNELWMDLNVTDGAQFHYSSWMQGSYEEEERHLAVLSKILSVCKQAFRAKLQLFWRAYPAKSRPAGASFFQQPTSMDPFQFTFEK